jgi:hypothetical protein
MILVNRTFISILFFEEFSLGCVCVCVCVCVHLCCPQNGRMLMKIAILTINMSQILEMNKTK